MVENPVGYGDYDREEFMDLLKDQVLFLKAEIYDAESNTDVAQKRFSGYMNNLLVKSAEGRYSDIFRLLYDVVEKKDKIRFDISEDAHWYSPTYYTDKLEKSIVSFYDMWISCAGSEAAGSLVRRDSAKKPNNILNFKEVTYYEKEISWTAVMCGNGWNNSPGRMRR